MFQTGIIFQKLAIFQCWDAHFFTRCFSFLPAIQPIRSLYVYFFSRIALAIGVLISNRRGGWLATLAGFMLRAIAGCHCWGAIAGAPTLAEFTLGAIAGSHCWVPCRGAIAGCHCWGAIAGCHCWVLATNFGGVHVGRHCWVPSYQLWRSSLGAIAGC